MKISIINDDTPNPKNDQILQEGIITFNADIIKEMPDRFSIYLKDENGTIYGGADPKISFKSITEADISIITEWFNKPHVVQYYSLRENWTEEEVFKKLSPYIKKEKPVYPFIIYKSDYAIGYIQYYPLVDFPWPNQDLNDDVINGGAGLDLFIGETDFMGKGLSSNIVSKFIKQLIWPQFDYCVVDPDIRNEIMIRCNEKVGFKEHKIILTEDALKRPVRLKLMILKKSNNFET